MSDFNSFSAISSLSALSVWNEPHDCASQHVSIVDDMQVAAPKGLQVKLQLVVILSYNSRSVPGALQPAGHPSAARPPLLSSEY
jgi:hypothetical protein